MSEQGRLAGLIPILATPFGPSGDLDEASLESLLEFLLDARVDGIALFGMASEAFALTTQERRTIGSLAARVVGGAVPLVAGVAATALAPALEQARHAAELGASALMVLPPFMVAATTTELSTFFGTLAAETGLPVMVQDAPDATRVVMSAALIAELLSLPGVDYVKVEASPSAPKVHDVVTLAGERVTAFGGKNAQFLLDELDAGAVGTMPAAEVSDHLAGVLGDYNRGDFEVAEERFTALLPLLLFGLQPGIAWAVHKEVLVERGIIADPYVRSPARPLGEVSRKGLRRLTRRFADSPGWKWKT